MTATTVPLVGARIAHRVDLSAPLASIIAKAPTPALAHGVRSLGGAIAVRADDDRVKQASDL